MGSTANMIGGDVGSFIDRNIGGTAASVLKDPLRYTLAAGTGGLSEVAVAGYNTLIGDPRFETNAARDRAKTQADATQAAIDENDRKQKLTQSRDQARASQKTAGIDQQGRGGTILTSPLGLVQSSASNNTLLGS